MITQFLSAALLSASILAASLGWSPITRYSTLLPATASGDTVPGKPLVTMTCDDMRPGNAVATVRFRLHRSQLDSTRLDVAAADDGFRTGHFASLMISRLARRSIRHHSVAFSFELKDAQFAGDSVTVRVAALESGAAYSWRVVEQGRDAVVTSPTTRAAAVTCR